MKRPVVVGNGMAGVACVEQIVKHGHDFEITILGDETHVNYNRILLSGVLAGEKSCDDIVLNDIDWYQANNIRACLGRRATQIDGERQVVRNEDGAETEYERLILATGSSPFVPRIPGIDKRNVHVFRTLDDTRALLEKSRPGLKTVVIGPEDLEPPENGGPDVGGARDRCGVVHLVDPTGSPVGYRTRSRPGGR